MSFRYIITFITISIFLLFQHSVNVGCSKPDDNDTVINPTPPPPVPQDTVSLVRKLEVLTSLYPSYNINNSRTYTFYYDDQKRLTSVGIKNYISVSYDSFTTRLEYTGNNKLPTRIIMPDIIGSPSSGPAYYDTTWFYYSFDGRIQRDSTNERVYDFTTGLYIRQPLLRIYSAPDALTGKVDWYWPSSIYQTPQLMRRDTVKINASGRPDSIKAQYVQDPSMGLGSYALANGFTFSPYVNPLSKLNISGTPFSLIYTRVKNELLGNSYHPLVFNSNGFAEYLDFISPEIPTLFYIGGYNRFHQMINSGAAGFSIDITPWTLRTNYPSQLRVRISTSLAGDSFIYRYTY